MTSEGQSSERQLEPRSEARKEGEVSHNFLEERRGQSPQEYQGQLESHSEGKKQEAEGFFPETRSDDSPQAYLEEDLYSDGFEPPEELPSDNLQENLPLGGGVKKNSPRSSEDEEKATTNVAKTEDWQEELPPKSSDKTVPTMPWWAGAFGACPDMKDSAEARGLYVRRFCGLFFPDDTAGATEVRNLLIEHFFVLKVNSYIQETDFEIWKWRFQYLRRCV